MTTTTTRRQRKAPASAIAGSKADALARGLRRFKTRACPHCRHLIKILREDGSTCEACFVRAVLYGEHNAFGSLTPAKRKPLQQEAERIRKAAERGPAEYRVDRQAAQDAIERPEAVRAQEMREADADAVYHAWEAEQERLAEQDVAWARDLMLEDPEGFAEAIQAQPWDRPGLDAHSVERIQRVFRLKESSLVPAAWLERPEGAEAINAIHVSHDRYRATEVDQRTTYAGEFELAEQIALGNAEGDRELAAAWLAAHGVRFDPSWVSRRELRELLNLVPMQDRTVTERDDLTGHRVGDVSDRRPAWDLVEPAIRDRITLGFRQREADPSDDVAYAAQLRRWQRYVANLRDRHAAAKGADRLAVWGDLMDAEQSRPVPPAGYERRKRERERDAFMAKLARKCGDRLRHGRS